MSSVWSNIFQNRKCQKGAAEPLLFCLCSPLVVAKKNGLDAIHDTVHEMARDEARHGRGLEGLLKRYFK